MLQNYHSSLPVEYFSHALWMNDSTTHEYDIALLQMPQNIIHSSRAIFLPLPGDDLAYIDTQNKIKILAIGSTMRSWIHVTCNDNPHRMLKTVNASLVQFRCSMSTRSGKDQKWSDTHVRPNHARVTSPPVFKDDYSFSEFEFLICEDNMGSLLSSN